MSRKTTRFHLRETPEEQHLSPFLLHVVGKTVSKYAPLVAKAMEETSQIQAFLTKEFVKRTAGQTFGPKDYTTDSPRALLPMFPLNGNA